MKKILKMSGFLICVILVVAFYAIKIEPYRLVVREHELGSADADSRIRVVQVSDIQISESYTAENLMELVARINEEKPDIFVFTGDLYENYSEYGPEKDVVEALKAIETTYGKYAIWGNRDCGGGAKRRYASLLEQAGIILLENSAVTVSVQENYHLWLGGIDDALLGTPDSSFLLEGMETEADYRILMTHEPDTADEFTEYDLDLILAGHSHGGQVKLPFWKGITTSMAEKYQEGFYPMNNDRQTQLYVNTGIGTSHYAVRFLVPPEITVFDIGLSATE